VPLGRFHADECANWHGKEVASRPRPRVEIERAVTLARTLNPMVYLSAQHRDTNACLVAHVAVCARSCRRRIAAGTAPLTKSGFGFFAQTQKVHDVTLNDATFITRGARFQRSWNVRRGDREKGWVLVGANTDSRARWRYLTMMRWSRATVTTPKHPTSLFLRNPRPDLPSPNS